MSEVITSPNQSNNEPEKQRPPKKQKWRSVFLAAMLGAAPLASGCKEIIRDDGTFVGSPPLEETLPSTLTPDTSEAEKIEGSIQESQEKPRLPTKTVTPEAGDNLYSILRSEGFKEENLALAAQYVVGLNDHLDDPNNIQVGVPLIIPRPPLPTEGYFLGDEQPRGESPQNQD